MTQRSARRPSPPTTRHPLVFVLWGHHSDELLAVSYIVKLRQAGVRVKLVRLERRKLRGANGLTLLPDLTLGEALPLGPQVRWLVIPFDLAALLHYLNDPRLVSLVQMLCDQGSVLVVGQTGEVAVLAQIEQVVRRGVAALLQVHTEETDLRALFFERPS